MSNAEAIELLKKANVCKIIPGTIIKVQAISDKLGASLFICGLGGDGTKDIRKGIAALNKLCQALKGE